MFDDLLAYYHENVVSAFVEYRDFSKSGSIGRSRDIRRGITAAEALFHFREHLPNAPTRATVESKCADYGLLGDIANAAKHKSVTQKTPHGPPLIAHASQIAEEMVITEYQDALGKFTHAHKAVVAKLRDGSERRILDVLTNVLNYWEGYLHSIGILSKVRLFVSTNSAQPKTRAECEVDRLNIEIVKGLRYSQRIRWQRYNYEKGIVEPMDLTGAKVSFRIYRPQFEVDVCLKNNATDKFFKRTIALTDEESEHVLGLKSEADKQVYIGSLPATSEALRQIAAEAGLLRRDPKATN